MHLSKGFIVAIIGFFAVILAGIGAIIGVAIANVLDNCSTATGFNFCGIEGYPLGALVGVCSYALS